MLKRTLFFGSPGKLSVKNKLLFYEAADTDAEPRSFAVEDIGFIVIESRQIVLTSYVIGTLAEHNVAVVFCDGSHLPSVQMVPYSGNALTQKIAEFQFSASEAVKGRLWKQTVNLAILVLLSAKSPKLLRPLRCSWSFFDFLTKIFPKPSADACNSIFCFVNFSLSVLY